ncbi:MAG: sigma-70 family RNA polymerase sigma factor [Acidobacteria bacterium]|nr:sigma-70 family RNA polymerase sigma factor [Acidobacteriota bacterium]
MQAWLVELDDIGLMQRVREECDESFRELMRRYQRQVFQHVYRTIQNAAASEELTQEVFLRVYLARERYEPTAKLITWLYRIAGNLSLNWLRDHRHETGFASLDAPMARMRTRMEANQVRTLIRKDFEDQVRQAVETLPYRQRMAVFLHKYDGMDYVQIASILGVSVSAVKSMLTRAYSTLRTSLVPQLEESRRLE